jgi:hypothetical protein
MPGTYSKRRTGLKTRTPRVAVPLPGIGGFDYPRGPFGETGFPGSTPASRRVHQQDGGGRKDRQLTVTGNHAEWVLLPTRRANGTPRQPFARTHRGEQSIPGMGETGPERRETPLIGGAPGSANVRNTYAQRYKARPELVRAYQPAPNPGKTGARLDAPSQYHPGVMVHGHPDGKPVPGMDANPGPPPSVTVQSRYVSAEGAQEGYAMNRPLMFARGGVAPYPDTSERSTGNHHLRGGRLTGQRYFGAIRDQQRIGLPSDSYGISRARGPRHRPVGFTPPEPWTANYQDSAPGEEPASDMIHLSPYRPPRGRAVRRG